MIVLGIMNRAVPAAHNPHTAPNAVNPSPTSEPNITPSRLRRRRSTWGSPLGSTGVSGELSSVELIYFRLSMLVCQGRFSERNAAIDATTGRGFVNYTSSSITHGVRYSRLKSFIASGLSTISSVAGSISSFRPPVRRLMLA